jgi:hypothetical protein
LKEGVLQRDSNCDFVSNHDRDDLHVAAIEAGVWVTSSRKPDRGARRSSHIKKWSDYESNWSKKTSPFLAYAWSNEG